MAFDHQYPRVYKAKVCPWIFQLYELDNPFLKKTKFLLFASETKWQVNYFKTPMKQSTD